MGGGTGRGGWITQGTGRLTGEKVKRFPIHVSCFRKQPRRPTEPRARELRCFFVCCATKPASMPALGDAQTAAYTAFLKTKRESYSLTRAVTDMWCRMCNRVTLSATDFRVPCGGAALDPMSRPRRPHIIPIPGAGGASYGGARGP